MFRKIALLTIVGITLAGSIAPAYAIGGGGGGGGRRWRRRRHNRRRRRRRRRPWRRWRWPGHRR